MTALERYARLEAEGRYFDGRSAVPRAVVVGFGKRTLTLYAGGQAVAHWPLASLRALSPRGSDGITLAPSQEAEERLFLDDPIMAGAIREVCPDLHRRSVGGRGLRRAGLWGVAAAASVVAIVFVLIPQLAERLAPMIPPERERALGDDVAEQLAWMLDAGGRDDDGICRGDEGVAALERMTERLTRDVSLPYPIRVDVLDHEMVNAVAMPGGRIFLFRGLIDRAATPEEVAGVLAHEIGHVIHRDPTTGVLRAAGTAGIFSLVLGDVFGAGVIAAAGEAMLNASYQREAEARADAEAIAMLTDAGLPTTPFAAFFARLADQQGKTPALLGYFASHPALAGRAERARAANRVDAKAFRPVLEDRGWVALKAICAGRD